MKKGLVMTIIAAVVLLAIAFGVFMQIKYAPSTSEGTGLPSGVNSISLTSITYDNFASEMSSNDMVKALPSNSEILVKFYNFNSGTRAWERAYLLKNSKIIETDTDANAEIVLTLHSKYLQGLTNENFCAVIEKANNNGDLGFESELSKASLLWKFKSMLEYKSCLGL
jgi:hypothetical protein